VRLVGVRYEKAHAPQNGDGSSMTSGGRASSDRAALLVTLLPVGYQTDAAETTALKQTSNGAIEILHRGKGSCTILTFVHNRIVLPPRQPRCNEGLRVGGQIRSSDMNKASRMKIRRELIDGRYRIPDENIAHVSKVFG